MMGILDRLRAWLHDQAELGRAARQRERAERRTDLMLQHDELMEQWARHRGIDLDAWPFRGPRPE